MKESKSENIVVVKDITEIRNMDNQLKIIIENIPFKVWLYDNLGTYINVNNKFAESENKTPEQIIGKNIKEFYCNEMLDEILKEDIEVIATKKPIKFEKDIVEAGIKKSVEIYKTPVLNTNNEVIAIVGTLVDVTKIKEAKDNIKKQVYTDPHTGLLNRRALYEYTQNIVSGSDVISIIIDVDNFKHINDTYGHNVGDRVLRDIANKLTKICENSKIFRFGGDEFIVVFEGIKKMEEIKYIGNKILKEISEIEINKRKREIVSVSMGIANCNCNLDKNDCDLNECQLIKRADIALYKAKEYGKNRYVIYTKGLEDEILLKFNIENDLITAIEKDEINLFYQPQYTKDNKLKGFEALFRWDNKTYSHIPVIEIIKIMEESKLIITLGKEIMKKACTFAKSINENENEKLIVFFNVSSVQIMEDDFIENIKNIIKETKVSTDCIGIEITETVLIENINENIQKIKQLKELGIKIALDDFGTGYSSFNYLVKLPLTEVKIDKNFVMAMDEGEEYTNLIKLIIDASHSLNLSIVAEGVETHNQLNKLKSMGIDYIQGYVMSKPLNEKKAIELLNSNRITNK